MRVATKWPARRRYVQNGGRTCVPFRGHCTHARSEAPILTQIMHGTQRICTVLKSCNRMEPEVREKISPLLATLFIPWRVVVSTTGVIRRQGIVGESGRVHTADDARYRIDDEIFSAPADRRAFHVRSCDSIFFLPTHALARAFDQLALDVARLPWEKDWLSPSGFVEKAEHAVVPLSKSIRTFVAAADGSERVLTSLLRASPALANLGERAFSYFAEGTQLQMAFTPTGVAVVARIDQMDGALQMAAADGGTLPALVFIPKIADTLADDGFVIVRETEEAVDDLLGTRFFLLSRKVDVAFLKYYVFDPLCYGMGGNTARERLKETSSDGLVVANACRRCYNDARKEHAKAWHVLGSKGNGSGEQTKAIWVDRYWRAVRDVKNPLIPWTARRVFDIGVPHQLAPPKPRIIRPVLLPPPPPPPPPPADADADAGDDAMVLDEGVPPPLPEKASAPPPERTQADEPPAKRPRVEAEEEVLFLPPLPEQVGLDDAQAQIEETAVMMASMAVDQQTPVMMMMTTTTVSDDLVAEASVLAKQAFDAVRSPAATTTDFVALENDGLFDARERPALERTLLSIMALQSRTTAVVARAGDVLMRNAMQARSRVQVKMALAEYRTFLDGREADRVVQGLADRSYVINNYTTEIHVLVTQLQEVIIRSGLPVVENVGVCHAFLDACATFAHARRACKLCGGNSRPCYHPLGDGKCDRCYFRWHCGLCRITHDHRDTRLDDGLITALLKADDVVCTCGVPARCDCSGCEVPSLTSLGSLEWCRDCGRNFCAAHVSHETHSH